ncbi:hypothetical protein K439DRAFT_1625630 [Ramaria rubella]|nr:hypothetical protein K439DRAFT_1625630 [Ramaria rubella]
MRHHNLILSLVAFAISIVQASAIILAYFDGPQSVRQATKIVAIFGAIAHVMRVVFEIIFRCPASLCTFSLKSYQAYRFASQCERLRDVETHNSSESGTSSHAILERPSIHPTMNVSSAGVRTNSVEMNLVSVRGGTHSETLVSDVHNGHRALQNSTGLPDFRALELDVGATFDSEYLLVRFGFSLEST